MVQDGKSGSDAFLLDISDLHVQYVTGDTTVFALEGFDLQVRRGEKLGLVGETGAGKTTMALSVMGLLPEKIGRITKGNIRFGGDDLIGQGEAYMLGLRGRRISMIFQDPMTSLNPTVSVGDQIMEVLDLHEPDMSRHEKSERVDRILSMVGIPPARKVEFPYQFSGGMKQRIVIAMALIAEPELLLAADHGAGRDDTGPDPGHDEPAQTTVQYRYSTHYARSGRSRRVLRPGGGGLCRPGGGAGYGGAGICPQAQSSVHSRAFELHT